MPTPLPTLPGVYYGKVEQIADGVYPINNTFAWQTDVIPGTAVADEFNATTLAGVLATEWGIHMLPVMPSQSALIGASIYPLGHPTSPASFVPIAGVGGLSTTIAPLKMAVLISEKVHRRGKGTQSRSYISCLSRDFIAGDGVHWTAVASMQTAWDAFNAAVKSDMDGHGLGVWTRVQMSKGDADNLPLPTPPGTYPITSSTVKPLLTTQRRRVPS
jgi:hypothetical protein